MLLSNLTTPNKHYSKHIIITKKMLKTALRRSPFAVLSSEQAAVRKPGQTKKMTILQRAVSDSNSQPQTKEQPHRRSKTVTITEKFGIRVHRRSRTKTNENANPNIQKSHKNQGSTEKCENVEQMEQIVQKQEENSHLITETQQMSVDMAERDKENYSNKKPTKKTKPKPAEEQSDLMSPFVRKSKKMSAMQSTPLPKITPIERLCMSTDDDMSLLSSIHISPTGAEVNTVSKSSLFLQDTSINLSETQTSQTETTPKHYTSIDQTKQSDLSIYSIHESSESPEPAKQDQIATTAPAVSQEPLAIVEEIKAEELQPVVPKREGFMSLVRIRPVRSYMQSGRGSFKHARCTEVVGNKVVVEDDEFEFDSIFTGKKYL